MKCHKPGTDQEIELFCYANGVRLSEYELPTAIATDQDKAECLVAVNTGDRITVTGSFSGSALYGCFDVLADGSYVGDRRLESSSTGEVKFIKSRRIEVKTVLDSPEGPGRTSILASEKVVEGHLHVKGVTSSDIEAQGGTKLGVGSLAVVVSLHQRPQDKYNADYPSRCVGSWQRRSQKDIINAGVSPTHELEVRPTKAEAASQRAARHKRRFRQARYGSRPWGQLVFHYRTAAAIHDAGCSAILRNSYALSPLVDCTEFKAANPKASIFSNLRPDMRLKPMTKVHSRLEEEEKASIGTKTGKEGSTMESDPSKTTELPSRGSVNLSNEVTEEAEHHTINLDELDVEKLMALLGDAEQSPSGSLLLTYTDLGDQYYPNAFNVDGPNEKQQHTEQQQNSFAGQDFGDNLPFQDLNIDNPSIKQVVPIAPMTTAQSHQDAEVLSELLDTQHTLSAVLQFNAENSHMSSTNQINTQPHTQSQQPTNISPAAKSTMTDDDRLENIVLAKKTKKSIVTADLLESDRPPPARTTMPAYLHSYGTAKALDSCSVASATGSISDKVQRAGFSSNVDETRSPSAPPASRFGGKSYMNTTTDQPTTNAEMKPEPVHAGRVHEVSGNALRGDVLAKRVRATSLEPASLAATSHAYADTSNEGPSFKKVRLNDREGRLGDLEIRKQELLRKLQQKKEEIIAEQKLFKQQQKECEEEERVYLESERLRAEAAERQRIESEERQRERQGQIREQEALRELQILEQQLGDDDMDFKKCVDQRERHMFDWNERRTLREMKRVEREMENEGMTLEDIEEIQAKLQATDHQNRGDLFDAFRQ